MMKRTMRLVCRILRLVLGANQQDEELSEEERPVRKSKQKKARAEVEGDDEVSTIFR